MQSIMTKLIELKMEEIKEVLRADCFELIEKSLNANDSKAARAQRRHKDLNTEMKQSKTP